MADIVPAGVGSASLDFDDLEGLLGIADTSAKSTGLGPNIVEKMKALPPTEHEDFWRKVLEVAEVHLASPPEPQPAEEHRPLGEDAPEPEPDLATRTVHAVAVLLAAFAEGALDDQRDNTMPQSFKDAAALMQELLLRLPDPATQVLVARCLEKISMGKFEGQEDYFGGILMYLIGRCLTPKSSGADVSRLYKVRNLMGSLDWEHSSIESLKLQLLRCVISPNFVRSQHGADMLASLYTVHPSFTTEVHQAVKNQVMFSRTSVLKAYSVGLYKAWKASEAGTRVQVEHCVQDWVLHSIRTARKTADRARAMLEEVHRNHHEEPLNELLCRAYGPVLWRALKVANGQVRENAARLLQYIFPLLPNEFGVAEKEQELQRQLRFLRETMEDPSEPVRRVGVCAVSVILKNYWDMLPPGDTAELLAVLMNKCAHDKKAPMVRAAVAEGFSWILQNPTTHPTMAAVLPQTSDLLNDRSPLVRVAFAHLLNAVSQCRGVSVSSVVNNDALLLRLAAEHTEGQAERLQRELLGPKKTPIGSAEARATPEVVAKSLTRLLAPSLFSTDLVQQVQRCQFLMQHWPLALLAMLTHIQEFAPVADRVKLAAALFRYGLGLREAQDGAVEGGGEAQTGGKPKMVATMLRVVGVLLEGAGEAPKVKKGGKKGSGETGRKLPKELEPFVYGYIKEDDFLHLLRASHEDDGAAVRLRNDLLFALSSLDPAKLPRTVDLVRHELDLACRGSGETVPSPVQLSAHMRAALRWGMLDEALEAAWERLRAAAARLGPRQAATDDTASAITVVEAALREPDLRSAVLLAQVKPLKNVVEAIASAFCSAWTAGLAEIQAPSKDGEHLVLGPSAEIWPRILGLIMRGALHIEHRSAPAGGPRAAAAASEDQRAKPDGDTEMAEDAAPPPAAPSPHAGIAETTLGQLARALTSAPALEALHLLEEVAAAKPDGSKPPSRKKVKGAAYTLTAPTDVDAILCVHERVSEALNATQFLSVLRPGFGAQAAKANASGADGTGPQASGGSSEATLLARTLESCLWRWAGAADALRPKADGSRLSQAWAFSGRLLQQMAHAETFTPDVIAGLRQLLSRATDEVPADDERLKKVLHALFSLLQYEPQLVSLVGEVIGHDRDKPENEDGKEDDDDPKSKYHPRVPKAILELLPSFRNLRVKFLAPEEEAAVEAAEAAGAGALSPGGRDTTKRRLLTSPTPLREAGFASGDVAPMEDDFGLESAAEGGNFSPSVRSESPPLDRGRGSQARKDSQASVMQLPTWDSLAGVTPVQPTTVDPSLVQPPTRDSQDGVIQPGTRDSAGSLLFRECFEGVFSAPMTAGSVAAPMTAGSVAAPMTAGSVAAPMTAGSVAAPMTAGSVAAPTTACSVAVPMTACSVAEDEV